MRRLLCRLRGHRDVCAKYVGAMVIPDGPGLVMGWRRVSSPVDEHGKPTYDGQGCTRCGRFRFTDDQ